MITKKKLFAGLIIALAALLSYNFISCRDRDNNNNNKDPFDRFFRRCSDWPQNDMFDDMFNNFFDDNFFRPIKPNNNKQKNNSNNNKNNNKNNNYSYHIVISNKPGEYILISNEDGEEKRTVHKNNPQNIKPNNIKPNNNKINRKIRFQPRTNPAPSNLGGFGGLPHGGLPRGGFGNIGGPGGFPHGGFFPNNQANQQANSQKSQKPKDNVTFKDVLGQEEAIKEVSEVVDFLKNQEKYHRLGAEMPKGILLEGPPGTGKTLLARAVANEAGCTFIHASGSQFINKYVGTGANNIRELFNQARAKAPAIIFIDEIDAVGSRKTDENQEYKHTINELLSQMDGFKQEEDIVVMAATNFAKSLDTALLRPGRFDRIVKVGLPNRKGRQDILKYYIDKKKVDPSVDKEKVAINFASRTPMFSGAKLKKLVNEATLLACRENSEYVTNNHFELGYDKITLGPKNHLERTEKQLKRTAYHETGHLLIKLLTDNPVAKVSILSRGDALGVTFEKEKYESVSEYQKEELLQKITALYGGFAAEKIF